MSFLNNIRKARDYFTKACVFFHLLSLVTFHNGSITAIVYGEFRRHHLVVTYPERAEHYVRRLPSLSGQVHICLPLSPGYQRVGSAGSITYGLEKIIVSGNWPYHYSNKKEPVSEHAKMGLYQKEVKSKLQLRSGYFSISYTALIVTGLVLVFSSFAFFLTRSRCRKEQHLKEELTLKVEEPPLEIRRTNLQLRLALNRARVNSHFVFNVLNSIRYMVLEKEPLQASNHLAKLSNLMRYALETSQLQGVPIQMELKMLEQYIQLEKTRLNNKFNYSITSDVNLDIMIPGMLIQPYVENAIIHGLGPADGDDLYLALHVLQVDDGLRVEIADNGRGVGTAGSSSHLPAGTSLGAERLQILSLINNKAYTVHTRDLREGGGDRKGTLVVLNLPFV
jgi:hypothetical protein